MKNSTSCKKKKTQEQKYKMYLDSFYILRSELKFKGYELNLIPKLNIRSYNVILKNLSTGMEYEEHLIDTVYTSAEEFIKRAENRTKNAVNFRIYKNKILQQHLLL